MTGNNTTIFNNLEGLSVTYVNHEGRKLPLKNLDDFCEAIRATKLKGKNNLNLIFYDDKLKPDEAIALNNNRYAKMGIPPPRIRDTIMPVKNSNKCHKCAEDRLLNWFNQYMKKFKKDLLEDIKSNVSQMIHEEFERGKKFGEAITYKSLFEKSLFDRIEISSPVKPKKRKKMSDKDTLDILEKREIKLIKKIEKFHSSKFDRMYPLSYLEKLENKMKALVEEKRKLLEKGRQQGKSKDMKKTTEIDGKFTKGDKSFGESNLPLRVEPGEEFSTTLNILNDGTVPWIAPQIKCLKQPGTGPGKDTSVDLPTIETGQSVDITLTGRVGQGLGNHDFAPGSKDLEPVFSCSVVLPNSKEKTPEPGEPNYDSKVSSDSQGNRMTKEDIAHSWMDFEKEVIANSQKMIQENIVEIEKRLHDIDLLRPCAGSDEKIDINGEPVTGCDFVLENKGKGWETVKPKGTDKSERKGENVKTENCQKAIESDSDSELSVIVSSEDDEIFIMVPPHFESAQTDERKPGELKSQEKPAAAADDDAKNELDKAKKDSNEVEVHVEKEEPTDDVNCKGSASAESGTPRKSSAGNVPGGEDPGKARFNLGNEPFITFTETYIANGTNLASVAFNTAKSVINTLQSVLKSENHNDPMVLLNEMGFLDNDLNLRLLKKHNNNVDKVISEILDAGAV